MSFQDVAPPHRTQRREPPRFIVTSPEETPPKRRSFVLHGKVHIIDEEPTPPENRVAAPPIESSRERLTRQSKFTQLTKEVQQFQRLVADLETLLPSAGQSSQSSWRARIMTRSAQEADSDLWAKLHEYEKTLVLRKNDGEREKEVRALQSSCLKLHRDFKRAHKSLVMALSVYQRLQSAEVSALGAVGWTGKAGQQEEDFFDRALRQQELEKMNKSMHQVDTIYRDLAQLVDIQQKDIDNLEENLQEAKDFTRKAVDHVQCHSDRQLMCGADDDEGTAMMNDDSFCGTMSWTKLQQIPGCSGEDDSIRPVEVSIDGDNVEVEASHEFGERVPQNLAEALRSDFVAIQQDLIAFGRSMLLHTKRLECGAPMEE